MSDAPDDFDELLGPPPRAETPELREAILQRTQNHLRRARWVNRAGKFAAVAAVFVVGVGVGFLRTPAERERVVVVREVETVTISVPVGVPVLVPSTDQPPPAPVALTGAKLELEAEQADEVPTAAKLYRQAGDAYLNRAQDYANAARCYRLFLTRAGDTALSPEAGDSWLLTSLKNAAFKEKIDATVPGG